jgi:hypothetical protein
VRRDAFQRSDVPAGHTRPVDISVGELPLRDHIPVSVDLFVERYDRVNLYRMFHTDAAWRVGRITSAAEAASGRARR